MLIKAQDIVENLEPLRTVIKSEEVSHSGLIILLLQARLQDTVN